MFVKSWNDEKLLFISSLPSDANGSNNLWLHFFNKKNRKTNFMMMNWKKNFLKPGKKTSYNVCFFPNCSKLLFKIITIGNSQIRVRCKHNHIILNLDWELEEKMCSKTTWKGVRFFNNAVQISKGIFCNLI